jgi:ABC-type Fe3+-siderophore transport system permease subunit
MPWYFYVAHFCAGAFLANSVPHFVQGICGNRFQTPLASPSGIGESSPVVNVLWSFFNLAVGGGLLHYFFPPALPPPLSLCAASFLGALATALWLSMHFSRVRRGPPAP